MKTKVLFLVNDGELFAFFPEEPYAINDDKMKSSYAHIGQHSACHIDYANESVNATKEEYASLKNELEEIGYELEVLNP